MKGFARAVGQISSLRTIPFPAPPPPPRFSSWRVGRDYNVVSC